MRVVADESSEGPTPKSATRFAGEADRRVRIFFFISLIWAGFGSIAVMGRFGKALPKANAVQPPEPIRAGRRSANFRKRAISTSGSSRTTENCKGFDLRGRATSRSYQEA